MERPFLVAALRAQEEQDNRTHTRPTLMALRDGVSECGEAEKVSKSQGQSTKSNP